MKMPMIWIRKFAMLIIPMIVTLLSLEIFSFVLTKANVFLVNETPRAYMDAGDGSRWRTENSDWGAWHKNNSSDKHSKPCFSVNYKSNEVGARDSSFNSQENGRKKYLLIGDSFAEGMGVNKTDTAEYLIEEILNIDVLNFGTGGAFGPIQYALIYDKLAKHYQHDGAIIYFLPANDFTDNDYDTWRTEGWTFYAPGKERYRPYYKKVSENEYSYFYPKDAVKRAYWDYKDGEVSLKRLMAHYLWSANAIRTAKAVLSKYTANKTEKVTGQRDVKIYSGYFDSSVGQQKAALFFIKKLVAELHGKEVILVIIPTLEDFRRIALGDDHRKQYWFKEFLKISAEEKTVNILDLSDFPPKDITQLYLDCDQHWSPAGHSWAANHIVTMIKP